MMNVWSRARQEAGVASRREAQYDIFQAYFQKLNDSMRNHTVTLASLTFLPYFAKEGNTIMLGAETAQALPCSNMWFSFIRGAAKQYGLLYFGNASVWNRWGYKDYIHDSKEPDTSNGYEMGRFAGTSLSLLKRLIYNHYMYGCDILGFENSWFTVRRAEPGEQTDESKCVIGDKCYVFTPIGRIQQQCARFVEENGRAGVMYTPVAYLMDFHAGWVPPRHLYSPDIYKTWGCLPYQTGDYQTHLFMSMLYPHYEDAGFFRSERGFATATPYGEIVDVLLSDVVQEVLNRYAVVILNRGTKLDRELQGKLDMYVRAGGTLIAFAGSVAEYGAEELFGVKKLMHGDSDRYEAESPENSRIEDGVILVHKGAGETRLIMEENGLEMTGETLDYRNDPNMSICQPYRWTESTRRELDKALREVQLLHVNNSALQYVTSVLPNKEYTFMVSSAAAQEECFDIVSEVGEITTIEEMEITDDVDRLPEFLPLHHENPGLPCNSKGKYKIEPGCVRLFRVNMKNEKVEYLAETNPIRRETVRYLALPSFEKTLRRALIDLPTFTQHFDGLVVPSRYLEELDNDAATREAHYLTLQSVHVLVDFSDLINHYPDLTLIGNIKERDTECMVRIEAILDKASHYPCDGVIFCPQRNAENEYCIEQAQAGFSHSIKRIHAMCEAHDLPLMMKNRVMTQIKTDCDVLDTAQALVAGFEGALPKETRLILASGALVDQFGQLYAINCPLAEKKHQKLEQWLQEAKGKRLPIALTAEYASWDEVIRDLEELDGRES